MRDITIGTITALTLVLGTPVLVNAETTAEDAFKYRVSIMTALKGHAGAISFQTRGLAGDSTYISNHARSLAALIGELETVFPEGSIVEDSEALPAIWEEPEAFAEALANVEEAAANLNNVAADGDLGAIGHAFMEVGKACKGCHERFRQEDEH
jgi:cytochrome c556